MTGEVILRFFGLDDVGRTRYRPPAALHEFAQVRDRECLMRGCHRPAQHCDHHVEWHDDGTINECNLNCLCEYHHYLKDEPGWAFHYDRKTGTLTVTTPTGREYGNRNAPVIDSR